jgi:hypothetical protein
MSESAPGSDERPAAESEGTYGDDSLLLEIADQLERDRDECWQALEGLQSVELELRLSIIEGLSRQGPRPGALALLRLLSTARDPATRGAALAAIPCEAGERNVATTSRGPAVSVGRLDRAGRGIAQFGGDQQQANATTTPASPGPWPLSCLVAPVDGRGRSSIVVSVHRMAQRRTAAFLCDLQKGICDVIGEVERGLALPGSLIEEVNDQTGAGCVRNVPELALGLLAGSLMLCGTSVPLAVRDWLDGTLGPAFRPAGLPTKIPGLDVSSILAEEMPGRVSALLDACPSWLDGSVLTFELAEEIRLREGRLAADPDRDAGAYRFLFEHRLIQRLELYGRMLLWMAWLWRFSEQADLSRTALSLACQLTDEQFAVPSHPFTVELTTRSLKAAQGRLGTPNDPRSRGSGA